MVNLPDSFVLTHSTAPQSLHRKRAQYTLLTGGWSHIVKYGKIKEMFVCSEK